LPRFELLQTAGKTLVPLCQLDAMGLYPRRIEAGGFPPNPHVHLLQHVLSFTLVIQDTETHAEKLRRGILVD
jgi:hypothetical protein